MSTPIRTTPFPKLPQRFDLNEDANMVAALRSNDLNYFHEGSFVSKTLDRVRSLFDVKYAVTTSSGTASVHVAVGAAQIPAGAEVVTSPITDMGTAIAILFQNAIPVFAEVDPDTSNITADSIKAVLTERTKAVIVVHLAGAPADLDPIVDLCRERNLILIEDCAQALGCTYKGQPLGTFGHFGCYSLNNQKHITSGEGGFVLMNDENSFYLAHNFADKFYDRHGRGVRLQGLGINYRMSELQGAVALAQFDRLNQVVAKRRALGDYFSSALASVPGMVPSKVLPGTTASYFFYWWRVDEQKIGMTRDEFRTRLAAEGIPTHGGYLPWPLHRAPVFQNKAFFAGGVWPAEVVSGKKYDYTSVSLPSTEKTIAATVRIDLHEGLSTTDIDDCILAIRKVTGV